VHEDVAVAVGLDNHTPDGGIPQLEAVVQIPEVGRGDDVQPHLVRGLLVEIQVGVVEANANVWCWSK
jgi:hypothetical protein